MARTSSLKHVYRELIVRIIIFTVSSIYEQFHHAERLFQLLSSAKKPENSNTSPQMIMKWDVDVHEEMCIASCCQVTRPCSKTLLTTAPLSRSRTCAHRSKRRLDKQVDFTLRGAEGRHMDILQVISFPMRAKGATRAAFVYGGPTGRGIFVRAALISVGETAQISCESV